MNPSHAFGRLILSAMAACFAMASMGASSDEPIVRIKLEPENIRLGESAHLRVTVLVPTWQPEPPLYPSFEVPNAVTRLPPDSAYPTSERIGADSWSGIIRNYQITPLIAADFKLGGETIRITWANPGHPNRVIEAQVPTATLTVRVPDGAAGVDPFLAGSNFTLERAIPGAQSTLKVGDALVIRYRARLTGMPALFIPKLAPEITSNLVAAYPEEPELIDADTAERIETVTLILEHGGRLELPGQTFSWWNTETEQIEQASIAPTAFDIAGPAPAPGSLKPEANSRVIERTLLLALLVLLALSGFALRRWLPRYLEARREKRAAFRRSEAHAFDVLRSTSDPRSVYAAALTWLNRLDPELDLRGFAAEFGDRALGAEVDALSRSLFEDATHAANLKGFKDGLGSARKAYLSARHERIGSVLARLNPLA